jgi:transcriptional repressor NrdR
VGLAILGPLRDLDEVAYLRFASVYRGFESLDDFEKAITELRSRRLADAGDTDNRDKDNEVHRAHDG